MKRTLHLGLLLFFMLTLGACSAGKQSAIEVKDPTSKTRFTVSSDGVISNAGTGLEWVIGPDQDTYYPNATNWVANCKVAGGGWRMPTCEELKTLYLPGVGKNNIAPAFKTSSPSLHVWAEPSGTSEAWVFLFASGSERRKKIGEYTGGFYRAFGVRSRPQ